MATARSLDFSDFTPDSSNCHAPSAGDSEGLGMTTSCWAEWAEVALSFLAVD
jgi:hypothetical protein